MSLRDAEEENAILLSRQEFIRLLPRDDPVKPVVQTAVLVSMMACDHRVTEVSLHT